MSREPDYFFIFGRENRVWYNSIALFVLPYLQILLMLIGGEKVERSANKV